MRQMDDKSVKVSGGILLLRSKSGTSKIEKVLVYTKRGKKKDQVKWLQKYVKEKTASKIPVWVTTYRRGVESVRKKKSLQTSVNRNSKRGEVVRKTSLEAGDFRRSENNDVCTFPFTTTRKRITEPTLSTIKSNSDPKSKNNEEKCAQKEDGISSPRTLPIVNNKIRKESVSVEVLQLHSSESNIEKFEDDHSESLQLSHSESSAIRAPTFLQPKHIDRNVYFEPTLLQNEEAIFIEERISKSEDSNIFFFKENKSSESDPNEELSPRLIYKEEIDEGTKMKTSVDDDNYDWEKKYEDKSYLSSKDTHIFASSRPTVVMAQYQSTKDSELKVEKKSKKDLNRDDVSDSDSTEPLPFILSGLRPLRSNQSRLFIDPSTYEDEKEPAPRSDDENPLLQDVPAEIFEQQKVRKKKSAKTIQSDADDSTPTDESKSSPTDDTTDTTDSGAVKILKAYQDTTYIIETGGVKLIKQDDFCLHIKDVPGGAYSSTSFIKPKGKIDDFCLHTADPPESPFEIEKDDFCLHIKDVPEGAYSSTSFIKRKGKIDDFCLHTADPPESAFSVDSLLKKNGFSVHSIEPPDTSGVEDSSQSEKKDLETIISKKSINTVSAIPEETTLTGSKQGDADSTSVFTSDSSSVESWLNSLLSASNKERRRSKIKQNRKRGIAIEGTSSGDASDNSRKTSKINFFWKKLKSMTGFN